MPSFVPLGIADYSGNSERGFVQFTYQIADNNAKELTLQIRDGSSVIYEEKITDANKLKQGEHIWKWDGFDSGGILDTAKLTQYENLNLYTIGVDSSNNYSRKKLDFSMRYDEVKWVDVKIDKNSKRIDVTLRVNLKDGGAKGIECYEKDIDPDPKLRVPMEVCPWDEIPKKYLIAGKAPLKTRTKKFEDLERLALEGLNYHWGRNRNHYIAKDVDIDGEKYEVYVNAINTTQKTMDDVSLIFNTNGDWIRSMNPGSVNGIVSFFGQVMPERIVYNYGYIKGSKKWYWLGNNISNVDNDFSYTAAHEIGHEILKAFSKAAFFSYKHKGSSTLSETLPVNDGGSDYPITNEIDLMKYYNNDPYWYDFKRIVADNKDLTGLLWLTKLEIK
ncbi:hypothetical protein SAMN05444344_2196 [Tenacibaculum mesophilum]|uniref:Uncharacterized protein n=1 Tax=Tenacibaculum mesophilum TaxID=104268 RepID=A0ABM7CCE6_9FLAO|nr:hypothetical protein [Tenacibaculum mesophilum]AZJ31403.1 hypothetical protein D6200_01975 [Tenacibaculum mesophilum]QFS29450.1 hypothetical protein F9Y86_13970 [Tenacibaculum mesophilum]SHF96467.1 hypothetical protein SAMN05444344_2196 [Tenacibaculum mesophilum]